MNLKIPIYIELVTDAEQSANLYSVRPLFFRGPVARDLELQRAIARFVKAFRQELNQMGKQIRHDALISFTFSPDLEEQLITLNIDLKNRSLRCRFLFVVLKAFDRRIAFTPSIPGLWFDLEKNQELPARAAEVLREYFREGQKTRSPDRPRPEDLSLQNKAWLSSVDLDIRPPLLGITPREEFRAILGGDSTLDGEIELEQVGRCLDWLYPNELNRVESRDSEVAELTRILKSGDRRPVLLIGPGSVGKTAIIEEYVYRRADKRKSGFSSKNLVWLIAPQRLISGMSFIGQWEKRLLAIIAEVKKCNHLLYFDDLLGLFRAGISRDSNLNVGQVLRPYIEKREIRVIGEITNESWRILRELDRGFADLFHLIPVSEPDENSNLNMLLGLIRRLEQSHKCRFSIDALPAVIDLQRRYVRDHAFPGKAASFLQQIAVKYGGSDIDQNVVLNEFQAKTGLSLWFLGQNKLDREEVVERLGREVVGQNNAVEAIADSICTAKARLQDPNRPLASFLFLGPTGVGKTQVAKSLASYLFSDSEKLLRFDMNEYITASSISRLIGTFDQPEGLLTGAIRRRPFSVILLDEVEKAHSDLFNLLLQVMGEGRLTDALGRTADFTNSIIVMTSNLGVKEASSELGFNLQRLNESSLYSLAAEKFFSPEFFNRIDRIVPFDKLNREAIEKIATSLIRDIFRREGLARRRCLLQIDGAAMSRIIDAGFHPHLGARALKRSVEIELTQPIAAKLSAISPASPTVMQVSREPNGLCIDMQELRETPSFEKGISEFIANPSLTLNCVEDTIIRIEDELSAIRPEGSVELNQISRRQLRYFAMSDQLKKVRRLCDNIGYLIESRLKSPAPLMRNSSNTLPKVINIRSDGGTARIWKELFAADEMNGYLNELATVSSYADSGFTDQLAELIRETAFLSMLSGEMEDDDYDQVLVMVRALGICNDGDCLRLMDDYLDLFERQLSFEAGMAQEYSEPGLHWLRIKGFKAAQLTAAENGTHLYIENELMGLLQVKVIVLNKDDNQAALSEKISSIRNGLMHFDPVTRIQYFSGRRRAALDLRSGLNAQNITGKQNLRAFVLSAVELPGEFTPE